MRVRVSERRGGGAPGVDSVRAQVPSSLSAALSVGRAQGAHVRWSPAALCLPSCSACSRAVWFRARETERRGMRAGASSSASGAEGASGSRVEEAAARKRARDGDDDGGGGDGGEGAPAAREDDELALRALRVLLQWRRDPETRGYDECDTRMFVHRLGATCRAMRNLCVEQGVFDRLSRLVRVFMMSTEEINKGLRKYQRAWAPSGSHLVLLIISWVDRNAPVTQEVGRHHRLDMSPGEERFLLSHLLDGVRARNLVVRHLWWQSAFFSRFDGNARTDRNGDEDVDMIASAFQSQVPGLQSLRVGDVDADGTSLEHRLHAEVSNCVYVHVSARGCRRIASKLPSLHRLELPIEPSTNGEGTSS